jgi:hypothetical protein
MIQTEYSRIRMFLSTSIGFPHGRGIEVGTFKGEFSKQIVSSWQGTLYMLDVWRPLDGQEYKDAANHNNFGETQIYSDAIENIKGYEDRAIMIRASSEVGSEMFANESLDFVYIDANHAYDYVKQDIELWWPKVKKKGWICGHDYIKLDWYNDPNFLPNGKDKHIWRGNFYHGVFGVNPAVDEFCKANDLNGYLTTEWFGSWFVQKP